MSDAQVDGYGNNLVTALQYSNAALASAPQFGLAAAFAMGCAIDPLDDTHKERAEAVLLSAQDVPLSGYMNLMMARAAKWGGSNADMFAIARARRNPNNPATVALIARAHFEQFLWYTHFDESQDAPMLSRTYFGGEVVRELSEASDATLSHPGQDAAELRLAHAWLAISLSYASRPKLSVRHLDRLKGFNDPTIWRILGVPGLVRFLIRMNAMLN